MNHIVKKEKIAQLILQIVLFIILLEKIYTPKGIATGSYNNITIPILVITIIIYSLLTNNKYFLYKILLLISTIVLLIISFIIFDSPIKELVRYILIMIILFFIRDIKPFNLNKFFKLVIVVGSIYTIVDIVKGIPRSTGFLSTSPTLYSLIILISSTYLIYSSQNIVKDNIYSSIGVLLIYSTGSRSTLILILLFYLIKISQGIFNKRGVINKFIFLIVLIISSIIAINILRNIWDGSIRMDANSSNLTRVFFIKNILIYMSNTPYSYITGMGAGFSYKFISLLTGINAPLHQDILTILCDYGVVGILIVIIFFTNGKYKWMWPGWVILFVGTFHNIIFFPISIILISLSSSKLYYTINCKMVKGKK